ncbi:DUF4231 domain-containing protein [Streptomyces sp. NPDC048558]|uniref:DUF4231 domain-containing protein n=1 Tax=Streptomyces sp. NPDC048558 TaxID=3155759 RepID=UPI0034069B43
MRKCRAKGSGWLPCPSSSGALGGANGSGNLVRRTGIDAGRGQHGRPAATTCSRHGARARPRHSPEVRTVVARHRARLCDAGGERVVRLVPQGRRQGAPQLPAHRDPAAARLRGIPVSAVISPGTAEVPAVLGGVVVVITGLRSVFHWQDDYLRFSEAREAVEAERRLYCTGAEPYADAGTRDRNLAASVTRIEQREMGTWVQLASPRTDAGEQRAVLNAAAALRTWPCRDTTAACARCAPASAAWRPVRPGR